MIAEKTISVVFFPDKPVQAKIVTLTVELAAKKIMGEWWDDECLDFPFLIQPIDRNWDWKKAEIESEGIILQSEKVAVITGKDNDLKVQGAMMISTQAVSSGLQRDRHCLLVELLFTAPWNRPDLRKDRQPSVIGVGTQLLIWGAWLSRMKGLEGRLRLDASPDFVSWYEKRGLQKLKQKPMVFEEVSYIPMELPADAAQELLSTWDE